MKRDDKRPLPPFGPYSMVPLWFQNYCTPIVGCVASCVWGLLWSKCRWNQSIYDVKITIASIARILGIAASTAATAVNCLIAEKLLAKHKAEKANKKNCYTVIWYTPENAAVMFKKRPKIVHRNPVDKRSPKFDVFTPQTLTEIR